jgi:hypothetical protein
MKKTLITLALVTAFGVPAAYAHGFQQQRPSLLGALLSVGNHGSIANVGAKVLSPSSLADVHANVLGNAVKADVDVGNASNRYDSRHGSSSVADVNLNVLGAVKANVDVGQSSRHGSSLLNLNASVLSGGVGNRQDHW